MLTSKILVIDDDPQLSRLVGMILSNMGGYTVLEENCPFAAVAAARRFQPDIILLDLQMPGKSGDEVALDLGNSPDLAHIPLVFISGRTDDFKEGARAGAPYLSKPFAAKLLLETVRRLCQARDAAACA